MRKDITIEYPPFGTFKVTHLADIDLSIEDDKFDHQRYQEWLRYYHPKRYFLFDANIEINDGITITSTVKNDLLSVYQPIDAVNADWASNNPALTADSTSSQRPRLRIAVTAVRAKEWCEQTRILLGKKAYNVIPLDNLDFL